jgi:hypothetical protein
MVSKPYWRKSTWAAWFLFLFFLLHACSATPTSFPTPAVTPTKDVEVVNVVEPTDIPTPLPTPTSVPLPDLAIFYTPPGSDPQYAEEIQRLLEEALAVSDIELKITTTLTRDDLGTHVVLVAALAPGDEISELIRSSPGTQFITIGSSELPPQNNLTVITTESPRIDHQAFMAGVIGAIITPDWRIGVISMEELSSQAFVNGGVYFCGLCRQVYPPFFDAQGTYIKFPLQYTLPENAGEQDNQDAAQYMIDRGVKTVYLPSGVGTPELLNTLEQGGINIIAASRLGDIRSNWIATLGSNPIEPLRELLPGLLEGSGGQQAFVSLEITDINPNLFSLARQRLANSILEDLEAGYISTGVE